VCNVRTDLSPTGPVALRSSFQLTSTTQSTMATGDAPPGPLPQQPRGPLSPNGTSFVSPISGQRKLWINHARVGWGWLICCLSTACGLQLVERLCEHYGMKMPWLDHDLTMSFVLPRFRDDRPGRQPGEHHLWPDREDQEDVEGEPRRCEECCEEVQMPSTGEYVPVDVLAAYGSVLVSLHVQCFGPLPLHACHCILATAC